MVFGNGLYTNGSACRFKDFASEVRGNMDVEVLLGRQHASTQATDNLGP
jgi:hypothetical protein